MRRFVYASSCSVYGVGSGEFLDETSPSNPQTAYAQCKVLVERDLLPMADDKFSVVFLRNATAYGPSPRMRFDIVLNDLCALAWTRKKIAMVSDGSPWRPIVHIEDICEAMRCAAEAPSATSKWRGLQRWTDQPEFPHPRNRANRCGGLSRLCGQRRPTEPRQPQLPSVLRQDRRRGCRAIGRVGLQCRGLRKCADSSNV